MSTTAHLVQILAGSCMLAMTACDLWATRATRFTGTVIGIFILALALAGCAQAPEPPRWGALPLPAPWSFETAANSSGTAGVWRSDCYVDEGWFIDYALAEESICRLCACGITGERCRCGGPLYADRGRWLDQCGACPMPVDCTDERLRADTLVQVDGGEPAPRDWLALMEVPCTSSKLAAFPIDSTSGRRRGCP